MTPEQFVYWLNGFVELTGGNIPSEIQWLSIQDHLRLVFNKVTPEMGVQKENLDFLKQWIELQKESRPYIPSKYIQPTFVPNDNGNLPIIMC